jgi:hypothetical protein
MLHFGSLTISSILPVVDKAITITPLPPIKQQSRNTLKHRLTSITHNINATHHNRTRSFQTTMHSQSMVLLGVIKHQFQQESMRARTGRDMIASTCLAVHKVQQGNLFLVSQ